IRNKSKLVATQLLSPVVESNPFERFRLYLPNALARHAKLAPHFLKRKTNPLVGEAVPHFQNLSLLRRQLIQNAPHLLGKNAARGILVWRGNRLIRDEASQRRALVVVLAHRALKRNGVLIYFLYYVDFIDFNAHLRGNFFRKRVAPQVL